MRAGANGSSTPMCSCCAPAWNHTPPRARSGSGFGISGQPEQLAVEVPRLRLAARRRGELHVVEAGDQQVFAGFVAPTGTHPRVSLNGAFTAFFSAFSVRP